MVYYAVQKLFFESCMLDLCFECVESMAAEFGIAITEEGNNMLRKMRFFLPGAAGGSEYDLVFVMVPKRSATDITYQGNRLLSPAWRYVALTRASCGLTSS